MLTSVEALTQAKALIADPARHLRNDFVDKDGRLCSFGALGTAVTGDKSPASWFDAQRYAKDGGAFGLLRKAALEVLKITADEASFGDPICVVNNTREHEVIMGMYDRAIELAAGALN